MGDLRTSNVATLCQVGEYLQQRFFKGDIHWLGILLGPHQPVMIELRRRLLRFRRDCLNCDDFSVVQALDVCVVRSSSVFSLNGKVLLVWAVDGVG